MQERSEETYINLAELLAADMAMMLVLYTCMLVHVNLHACLVARIFHGKFTTLLGTHLFGSTHELGTYTF